MSKLIGITGPSGSGKDEAGAIFVRAGFKRLAFADALKQATAAIAGEHISHYHTQEGKAEFNDILGMSRREALQQVGMAMRHTLGEQIWVRSVLLQWMADGSQPTVITDCRFDNEADAIANFGGTIIQIVRPGPGQLTGEAAKHASEAGVSADLIDIEILNDGTLTEFRSEVDKIVQLLADFGLAGPRPDFGGND